MDMIQLTDKGHWAVKVPDDATELEICNYGLNDALEFKFHIVDGTPAYDVIDLPTATWHFLFTTNEATEEDSRKVVRELPVGKRWTNYNGDYPVWYHSGKESLRSLLRSKSMEGNWAVVEQLK